MEEGHSLSESAKKKRRIRPAPQTVRERAEKGPKPAKRRPVRTAFSVVARPFKVLGRFVKRILRPFRFILRPFKTRPMRFIGRILAKVFLINYFKSSWKELKQVNWPSRKETWQLTFAVFIFALVFGLVVTITDYGLDKVFRKVLLQ